MSFQATFKALSDPTRREILQLLRDNGPMTAGEIVERFDMTGATVSHHLSILKSAGLVDTEKQGKYIRYELNLSVLDEILSWMSELMEGSQ
ncbi:MAG: autorepressor SdpR family transcription factor [Butyricicoccus sp.]